MPAAPATFPRRRLPSRGVEWEFEKLTIARDFSRNVVTKMLNDLNKQWEEIPDVRVNAFLSGGNRGGGGGGSNPIQVVIGGPNYEELARWRDIILARASENPGILRLDSDLR